MGTENSEMRGRHNATYWHSACRGLLSGLVWTLVFCFVACVVLWALLDVGFIEFVDFLVCRSINAFTDWGTYVSFTCAFAAWHFLRRWLHSWEFAPQSRRPKPVQGSRQNCRGCLPALTFAGLVVFVSLLFRADSEIVEGVKWRYEVSDGSAIIGRGRSWAWPRAAISTATGGDVVIPLSLGDKPVAGIGGYAFYMCKRLRSVAVPKSVTNVAWSAFSECPIEKIYVEKGDAERVKEMLRGKGIDLDKVEFVEREEVQPDCATSNNANGQLK